MNQVVEVKLVDLTGIQLGEAVADVLQQRPQLLLVVGADEFTRRSALRLLLGWLVRRRHTKNLQAPKRNGSMNVAPGAFALDRRGIRTSIWRAEGAHSAVDRYASPRARVSQRWPGRRFSDDARDPAVEGASLLAVRTGY
jgi:hypothetical protein